MYAKRLLVGAALAVVGLLGFTGSANATTVNVTGVVTVCTPTCLSFDFLDVGSEVTGSLDFGAGFDDGNWTGGDVVDLSFTVFNPAVPVSPSNPTVLDPTPEGSGLVVANGQTIVNPRGTSRRWCRQTRRPTPRGSIRTTRCCRARGSA